MNDYDLFLHSRTCLQLTAFLSYHMRGNKKNFSQEMMAGYKWLHYQNKFFLFLFLLNCTERLLHRSHMKITCYFQRCKIMLLYNPYEYLIRLCKVAAFCQTPQKNSEEFSKVRSSYRQSMRIKDLFPCLSQCHLSNLYDIQNCNNVRSTINNIYT